MYGRGPFWGGRYMRRRGFPLFPMGGYGMGMGGGGLIGDLMAGGIGYMMGKQSAQQAAAVPATANAPVSATAIPATTNGTVPGISGNS